VVFAEQSNDPSAETLGAEVDKLMQEGKYSAAIPAANNLLSNCEKLMGPEHPATGIVLDKRGKVYDASGDYAKAEPIFKRAVQILEKTRGPNDRHTTNALNDLAELYRHIGSYVKAETIYKRVLEADRETRSPDERNIAAVKTNLASVYTSMGQYSKAEALYLGALAICEKVKGPNDPDTATVCNQLALLYSDMGDYDRAEPLFSRALRINESAFGPEHPNIAILLGGLGNLYKQTGDLFKAESALHRALQITEQTVGQEHPSTAQAANNLASLYEEIGDYAKARPLYERALSIREKVLGENSADTATALNNLAGLCRTLGDYSRAVGLFQRSLVIYEKVFGANHPRVALALNNLAHLYSLTGDYSEAEPLYRRALRIFETVLGKEHPQTAVVLNNLGAVYRDLGRYSEAVSFYRRSARIAEHAFGLNHIQTATALRNLAYAYLDIGKQREAADLASRVNSAEEKYLAEILSFTSERQRLAFQQTANPYSLPAKLNASEMLAQTILRQKGIVLDSLLEDRRVAAASETAKYREMISQISAAKQRLMQVSLTTASDMSEQTNVRGNGLQQSLSERIEQMEAELGREIRAIGKTRQSFAVTTNEIRKHLGQDQALVEFIRYSEYQGKGKWAWAYGGIVICSSAKPKWVPLGDAAEIERNISAYKDYVRGGGDEAMLTSVLQRLHDQLWRHIEDALNSSITTVAISPDSELNFISFATLLDPQKKFLGEKYSLRYLASGRDLLRESIPSRNRIAVIFANPDFQKAPTAPNQQQAENVAMSRAVEVRDLQNISFRPLPKTADEANALEHLLRSSNTDVRVFRGTDASKAELRGVVSPRILHIASDGFFLPETEVGGEADLLQLQVFQLTPLRPKIVNPMYRSGIALAGAQKTIQSWSRGDIPAVENDGILTAEEAGGLQLDGTWLVVLSACDTGVGEARAGEGVLGLRRGFVQAGAQNLLFTLWPIPDAQATIDFIREFYETAEKTGNAPQALADTQRKWLVAVREKLGIRTAVRFAGPFVMSSQGHL